MGVKKKKAKVARERVQKINKNCELLFLVYPVGRHPAVFLTKLGPTRMQEASALEETAGWLTVSVHPKWSRFSASRRDAYLQPSFMW